MLKCNFECRSAISSIEVRFRMLRGDFECCSVISGVQVRFRMLKCDSERRTTARACFGDRSSEHYKVSYSLTCESSSACASKIQIFTPGPFERRFHALGFCQKFRVFDHVLLYKNSINPKKNAALGRTLDTKKKKKRKEKKRAMDSY